MSAPYSSKAIANEFIELAQNEGVTDLSPMKLQKLVYYAHGWFMAFTDNELIKEEIQAWNYGPVVPEIYDEFKHYGHANITSLAEELKYDGIRLELITPKVDRGDENANDIVEEVWRKYKHLTPVQLSNATHADDSPWHVVASEHGDKLPRNIKIPNSLIKKIFKEALQETEG